MLSSLTFSRTRWGRHISASRFRLTSRIDEEKCIKSIFPSQFIFIAREFSKTAPKLNKTVKGTSKTQKNKIVDPTVLKAEKKLKEKLAEKKRLEDKEKAWAERRQLHFRKDIGRLFDERTIPNERGMHAKNLLVRRGSLFNAVNMSTVLHGVGRENVYLSASSLKIVSTNLAEKTLDDICLSNCFYGFRSLRLDIKRKDVIDLLTLLTEKASTRNIIGIQAVSISLSGMVRMTSDIPEMRRLLGVFAEKARLHDKMMTALAVSEAMIGMQGMKSDVKEVRDLVAVLAVKISACKQPLTRKAVRYALFGMQNMTSDSEEVRSLLSAIAEKIPTCEEFLSAGDVADSLLGLQGMSSDYPQVRAVLAAMAGQIERCRKVIQPRHIKKAFIGLQRMDVAGVEEVKAVLDKLGDKVPDRRKYLKEVKAAFQK